MRVFRLMPLQFMIGISWDYDCYGYSRFATILEEFLNYRRVVIHDQSWLAENSQSLSLYSWLFSLSDQ